MTPEQVFDHFGGKSPTARALGISHEAVRKWELVGVVPEQRQFHIEVITNGVLVADREPQAAGAAG